MSSQTQSSKPTDPPPRQAPSNTDRRFQVQVAILGIAGALLGALIGGTATMLGSIYQNHSAEASQIQSERQNIYVTYNGALDNFAGDVTAVMLDAKLGLVPTNWVNKLISDNAVLVHASDQVIILASPQLLRIVQGEQRSAEALDIDAQALEFRMKDPSVPISQGVPVKSVLISELSSGDLYLSKTEKDYQDVARIDLGTN